MSIPMNEERGWEFLMKYHDVCAGVLMSPTEGLTTCECVIDNSEYEHFVSRYKREEGDEIRMLEPTELRVRTKDIMSTDSEFINITEVRVHPKCIGDGSYDLAMVRLERPVNVSESSFANFPFGEDWNGKWFKAGEPEVGCHLDTHLTNSFMWSHNALYAKTMYGHISEIPVEMANMNRCDKFIKFERRRRNFDRGAQICVEAEPKPLSICKADLGSPLICNDTLIGITTVTELLCHNYDGLSIVSTLDGAWDFVYDFMEIGHQHFCVCCFKKLYKELVNLLKFLINFGL